MYINLFSLFKQESVSLPYIEEMGELKDGTMVVFQGSDGEEIGKALNTPTEQNVFEIKEDNKFLRIATKRDLQILKQQRNKEKKIGKIFQELVTKHELTMHMVSVKYSFDDTRIEFMFTAPDRVDFRELVKDLARHLKRKIHLKQIGPRDRAKFQGGIGICGREICCNGFLRELKSVGMDALRTQNLTHKSTDKLSGLCGKLRCCVNYEVELYKELKKTAPKIGTHIQHKDKKGEIIGVDVINDRVKVRFKDEKSTLMLDISEIKIGS